MRSQKRAERLDGLYRLINFLAESNRLIVSVSALLDALDMSYEEIIPYLLELVRKGALKPLIRVICPNCGSEVEIYASPSEIPSKTEVCEMCHSMVNLTREESWELVFKINLEKLHELVDKPFFRKKRNQEKSTF